MEELPISSRRSQLKRLSSEGSTPSLATMVLQSLSNYLLALVHIEIWPTTRPLDLMSRSLARAAPQNLHSYAHQQERGEL